MACSLAVNAAKETLSYSSAKLVVAYYASRQYYPNDFLSRLYIVIQCNITVSVSQWLFIYSALGNCSDPLTFSTFCYITAFL